MLGKRSKCSLPWGFSILPFGFTSPIGAQVGYKTHFNKMGAQNVGGKSFFLHVLIFCLFVLFYAFSQQFFSHIGG
jgi:hypothetical protein